jgi:hypothetical protein
MPFNIINLDTKLPYMNGSEPWECDSGEKAAEVARDLSYGWSKYQPRRMPVSTEWRERELARFADGTYRALPWVDLPWFKLDATAEHFAHVSVEKDGKVAFTDGSARGEIDRQTRLNPGRYLTRYYSGVLSPDDIRALACAFDVEHNPIKLLFAHTADEIEHVYTEGPSSCMSGTNFASPCHPVRIYAAGDLAVAYVSDAEEYGNISARALCWPAKMIYGRVYGDEDRLTGMLANAGYKEGNLRNAKMTRIKHEGAFVMPYIDGSKSFTDHGTYLTIEGNFTAESQNGLSESGEQCERCGDRYDNDKEGSYIEDVDQSWCESCTNNHAFYCDHTSQTLSDDNAVRMANGETWSQAHFDSHGFECEGNGRNYSRDDDDYVVLNCGTVWCMGHFERNGYTCPDGEHYANGEGPGADGEDDTDAPDAVKHVARAGRDESASQAELPLKSPNVPAMSVHTCIADLVQIGEVVRVRNDSTIPDGDYVVGRTDDGAGRNGMRLFAESYGDWIDDRAVVAIIPDSEFAVAS